jgi:chromosomal replication initiator protein
MQEIIKENTKALPTESEFVETIYKAFGVTEEQMKNIKCRKRELAQSRQWHMYIRFKVFKMSSTEAGNIYDKDHATVLHAIKTVNNLMETDRKFQEFSETILPLLAKYGIKFIKVQKNKWI